MGWWRTLLSWRDAPTSPNDATVVDSVSFTDDIPTPIDELISRMFGGATPRAGREEALSVPAVLRGRNLICSISTLPLTTRAPDRTQVRTPLLEQIDDDIPNVVTLAQTVEDLLFEGLSWWRITRRYADGYPASAMHLDYTAVSLQPPKGYPLQTLPSGVHPDGVIWVDGNPVRTRDMVRFDSPNPGLLKASGRTVRRAIALEHAATMYANDPRMLDYFTPNDGADPVDDGEIRSILDDWQRARRDRATGYVPAALNYNTVDTMSPADLQLAELQKQATIDLANALGLDAEDLQVSTTSRTYANAVDRRRDRINDVLAPYMSAITDRLSMTDVTARGHTVVFDLDDYMRADPTTRWNTYEVGLRNQIVSVSEVREQEGLPAVPVESVPRPRPASPQQRPRQEAGMSSIVERFSDEDTTTRIAFELSEADAEFRVDREKRTISGLLLPWNKVARSGFAKWRFNKDSLFWGDESRVKLNREHDRERAVAYAVRLQSTAAGLDGSFRVARGPAGDEVLSLAEDKVLDGFSVEVDFDEDGSSWARDPDDDMVRLVSSARLAGVAITAAPAFDDARVSGVAATRKDTTMPDEPTAPEAPAAGPDTAAFTTAVDTFTNTVKGLTEVMQANQTAQTPPPQEGPTVVDPTRRTAQLSVTEEPLYRFDGVEGSHDFSTDIIKGAKGDYDALKRAEQFIQANFVDSGNVSPLNPPRDRPDLYVDQLEYMTPIWDSIRKGTIPDNTPFVLPKFASSSGLVGDHTEGVEPTPGALTATSQTITPSPVSGKVEVTREAWDQGGSPQLSTILWRQMTRAYDEGLEQASADMLDALTVTAIDLAGADDEALAEALKGALASLHFVRGGNRFRDFKLESGLYEALATATATDGRPLFPILNPQNADGRTDAFFGAISIGGLAGIPSWALPPTVAGTPPTPGNSYLYNREDVHGWASAPQRLQFEYRVAYVDVGIWGYKALAATRADGVRRITYDSIT